MPHTTPRETPGQRLRRLREEAGLSQRRLSVPKVTAAYISRLEADQRTPSIYALRKLAPKLGVSVTYLETGKEHPLVECVDEVIQEAKLKKADLPPTMLKKLRALERVVKEERGKM